MPPVRIIPVRPLDQPELGVAAANGGDGGHSGALDAAISLLGAHFAWHAASDPAFVLKAGWADVYRRAMSSSAAAARHRLTIAVPEGEGVAAAIGVCSCWMRAGHISEGETGVISELFVAPAHRGEGVGRLLADDAAQWLVRMGAVQLSLQTPLVGGARAFWERLGYAVTSHGMSRRPRE